MNALFRLLAEKMDERFSPPDRPSPRWEIKDNVAVMSWDSLGGMYRKGTTLMVVPPPPFLPFVEQLKTEGWKRGDSDSNGPGWLLYARYVDEETGVEVRVEGFEPYSAHPEKNRAIPFFADPIPQLPHSRAGKNQRAKWKAEYDEWDRKCRADEW